MTYRARAPRALRVLSVTTSVLLLSACPGTSSSEDGEESESESGEEGGACEEPGSELLPEAKTTPAPSRRGNPPFTCTSGWATDAPSLAPSWTVRLPTESNQQDIFISMRVEALSDGGAVVYGSGLCISYDAAGEVQWELEDLEEESNLLIAAEDAGTVLIAQYNWNTNQTELARHAGADGSVVDVIDIPWNDTQYPSPWALHSVGSNILLGAFDADSQGDYEDTLLYLDGQGNELLRRSTNIFGGLGLAVNDSGTAMFGFAPSFMISLEDGAVIGQLTPSAGFASAFVGAGDNFYAGVTTAGDMGIGAYSATGGEQWLQQYDRATLNDTVRGIDASGELVVVAGMTAALNWNTINWFSSQPMVVASDLDGNALWTDRIDAFGEASDVAIGPDGSVYVVGLAELPVEVGEEGAGFQWIRKYEP